MREQFENWYKTKNAAISLLERDLQTPAKKELLKELLNSAYLDGASNLSEEMLSKLTV